MSGYSEVIVLATFEAMLTQVRDGAKRLSWRECIESARTELSELERACLALEAPPVAASASSLNGTRRARRVIQSGDST